MVWFNFRWSEKCGRLKSIFPSGQRFEFVMRSTKALTIARIGKRPTILQLMDVVGIETVVGPSFGAALPIHHCLAAIAGARQNCGTPGLEFVRIVDGIFDLWR